MIKSLLPVLVVSTLNCLRTGCINLSFMGLIPHHINIQKQFLPSKVNGATVGATVAVAATIDCAWINTIAIFCNSAAESVLGVCNLVACIGAGEWIPGTRNANCRLAHLTILGLCRMDGNFMTVSE